MRRIIRTAGSGALKCPFPARPPSRHPFLPRSTMADLAVSQASATSTAALMANAIRALAMDAVQQANSGHPGAPMGMAEIAVALWGPQHGHLRHNPANP